MIGAEVATYAVAFGALFVAAIKILLTRKL